MLALNSNVRSMDGAVGATRSDANTNEACGPEARLNAASGKAGDANGGEETFVAN